MCKWKFSWPGKSLIKINKVILEWLKKSCGWGEKEEGVISSIADRVIQIAYRAKIIPTFKKYKPKLKKQSSQKSIFFTKLKNINISAFVMFMTIKKYNKENNRIIKNPTSKLMEEEDITKI